MVLQAQDAADAATTVHLSGYPVDTPAASLEAAVAVFGPVVSVSVRHGCVRICSACHPQKPPPMPSTSSPRSHEKLCTRAHTHSRTSSMLATRSSAPPLFSFLVAKGLLLLC
jgi:hypothetical protein